MTYEIISTGSKGNAVLLGGSLLIDCGVPFKALSNTYRELKLVLLTHWHSDHINKATVKKLADVRPTLRFACCSWMVPHIAGLVDPRRIDILECDRWYDYGQVKVSPVSLFHDVPNCGYRLDFNGCKVFYATDTGTLDGIEAKGYDLYMLEANHTRAGIEERAKAKMERGEYSYELRAAETHLSEEQALDFIGANAGPKSEYVFLHQHSEGDSDDSKGLHQ